MAGRVDGDELIEDLAARLVAAERVNRERGVQLLCLFVEWKVLGCAEVLPMPLGGQHAPDQAQFSDRVPQFLHRRKRVVDRQIRHGLEAR